MRIEGIGNLAQITGRGLGVERPAGLGQAAEAQDAGSAISTGATGAVGGGFGDVMTKALGEVNSLQGSADVMAQKLATGDVDDIHQVMLALDKASTAFGLTVQVRNKVLEAYQEVMRMQV